MRRGPSGYAALMATKRIDIVKSESGWAAKHEGRVVMQASTKRELVSATARTAKQTGEPTSVRIHRADGLLQEERTYPRSADPRGSKG